MTTGMGSVEGSTAGIDSRCNASATWTTDSGGVASTIGGSSNDSGGVASTVGGDSSDCGSLIGGTDDASPTGGTDNGSGAASGFGFGVWGRADEAVASGSTGLCGAVDGGCSAVATGVPIAKEIGG